MSHGHVSPVRLLNVHPAHVPGRINNLLQGWMRVAAGDKDNELSVRGEVSWWMCWYRLHHRHGNCFRGV